MFWARPRAEGDPESLQEAGGIEQDVGIGLIGKGAVTFTSSDGSADLFRIL